MGTMFIVLAMFSSATLAGIAYFARQSQDPDEALGAAIIGFTSLGMALVLALVSVPCIVAGWGLLKHRRWARIIGIVVAALSLVRFPLGTAFGVYALWVLLSKRTEALFEPSSAASA